MSYNLYTLSSGLTAIFIIENIRMFLRKISQLSQIFWLNILDKAFIYPFWYITQYLIYFKNPNPYEYYLLFWLYFDNSDKIQSLILLSNLFLTIKVSIVLLITSRTKKKCLEEIKHKNHIYKRIDNYHTLLQQQSIHVINIKHLYYLV